MWWMIAAVVAVYAACGLLAYALCRAAAKGERRDD